MKNPRLVVFDLDFTLWDCGGTWCDCLSPPFSRSAGRVVDRTGRHVTLYDDVLSILDRCERNDLATAIASRTEQPDWAHKLLCLLKIDSRFNFAEIYPSSKLRHFRALHAESGIQYEDVLFFDDEMRNIIEVGSLGVTAIHVTEGLSESVFADGLVRWQHSLLLKQTQSSATNERKRE